ncbi:partitioning protein, partial [human gut metagenome]
MNTSHLTEKAMRLMEQHPAVPLCHESYNYNEAVIDRLTAMGYEVESLKTYATKYPESPQAPQKEDYDTTEEYEDAEKDYGQELNGYTEKCEAIRTRSEAGEISLYLRIESNDITLCYV